MDLFTTQLTKGRMSEFISTLWRKEERTKQCRLCNCFEKQIQCLLHRNNSLHCVTRTVRNSQPQCVPVHQHSQGFFLQFVDFQAFVLINKTYDDEIYSKALPLHIVIVFNRIPKQEVIKSSCTCNFLRLFTSWHVILGAFDRSASRVISLSWLGTAFRSWELRKFRYPWGKIAWIVSEC